MTRPRKPVTPSLPGDPKQTWRALISERGLKWSHQREIIAETLFQTGGHLSVDELLTAARKRDPHVSQATVYRTVKLLADFGLAAAAQFGDRQTRYEKSGTTTEHHDHLICTSCEKIVEFVEPRIEELQVAAAHEHGFEVTEHKLELYGLCADCRRKRR